MERVAILGASGCVGSVVARGLVARGAGVILLGRNPEKLEPLGLELGQPWRGLDVTHAMGVEEYLRSQVELGGPLTGIINCVGSVLLKPAHLTSDEEFHDVVLTNLGSAFAAVRSGGKLLRGSGGSIVLFASAAAEVGIANHEAIAAAKGGVIGLGRSAAATYAPQNIRVNVVSPGLVQSEMTRRIWENPASASASVAMHALGRLGRPEQVASLALWLLDPANDWVTGQVMGVDGGLGHVLPRR